MNAWYCGLVLLAVVAIPAQGHSLSFFYVDPGDASCPAAPAPSAAARKPAQSGVPMSGSISVPCGLDKGSYTVTLRSTDPGATFSPTTFLVNFGGIVGDGGFTVTFATAGVQTVSATITG